MIKRTRAELNKCIIHKVANKYNSGQNTLSENLVRFDEESYELLMPFLLKPFANVTQSYRFNHHADVRLNEINNYTSEIFEDEASFIEHSKNIVNHLYEQSNSAQIKKGDVLVAYFEGLEYKDVLTEAVGIFKIESKVDFFQTYLEDDSFDVVVQKGISTKKLDKGCLILNSSDTEGPVILSVDNNNYDAQYWIKNFLNVKYANDRNLHTQHYLEMCKDFSENIIQPEFGKQEQSNFLANTVDYFKEHESVDYHDFKQEVFQEDKHKDLFEDYKKHFEKLNDVLIRNNFDVSDAVLKKEKSKFKTEIKLDTNIQIKIDIDAPDASSEYLEKGYDEDKKMKFYKVYFNDEK
ncbi:nucleoid-associated protein [Tenacibaculum maritimum]|uniref:nucleoid-associated protein n=1 Tax=Tenacibaculum maritimum TaxID=107401 RepID=UPI001E2E29E2|nr:nucleoid-associated protein [Tenacibaculum maritimum]MCD9585962.1 nucleoid-associated protein [Tenacibaculum maritimum]MCD9611920.1 nucleoid-associated protein [Tenacibaculum maritimum]MCD9621943.1 nucleoid-associated protein [Tenacibaculum maritimum]MCD9628326.1 nucleoid-associated protein [Tenacibaculum maritimum]MCD9631242.1 nucleoid-associated protein [Tenacibaculum maritimum]